ncbi:hypothetical protein PROH_18870 [Prochlorothrix hollandica PCC 9006 = CALU 1027]|uniref:Uncharacterized protein n=1 Tax=Prochlorothrix hollandica PCC 9006 = CALU 1027 TaxID=317619 RepID=A0A0M2PTK4_PROHO|nr:hypothetical protein PROH_18870 [Prochlorothrix hollandica PCC 9006 = CALU 1027]
MVYPLKCYEILHNPTNYFKTSPRMMRLRLQISQKGARSTGIQTPIEGGLRGIGLGLMRDWGNGSAIAAISPRQQCPIRAF